jgi:hypothetical protein
MLPVMAELTLAVNRFRVLCSSLRDKENDGGSGRADKAINNK